jgi:Pyridoxamine 5'-phosphate oxidase
MNRAGVYGFVATEKLAVISSASPGGAPQSALVGIAVTPELEIIFDTLNTTRKYRNLMAMPECSFVIGCSSEVTVQYEGVAEEPGGAERERWKEIYFRIWPECREHEKWPGITWIAVRPRWIRYSNFEKQPPEIAEFRF